MLKSLRMVIDKNDIDYKKSSNLQGVLFERIDPLYADELHIQQRHPYSQYICDEGNEKVWYVNTLDEQAAEEIIGKLLAEEFCEFTFKKQNETVKIKHKEIKTITHKELLNDFYGQKAQRYYTIKIVTPMAFKQRGKYIVWPDLRLFYQSLMNKYSAVLHDVDMMDEDTLDMLADNSEITRYNLHTTMFPLEGIQIPAFTGWITIKVSGTDTMASFVNMLLRFGEFSGVGIKTAMGMGAIKILERRNTKNDR